MPARNICALRRLAQRNNVAGSLRETLSRHFHVMLDSGEYCRVIAACTPGLEAQQQLTAAFGTGMLREKKNACLGPLGRSAVAEPRGQRHTRGMLGRDAGHIQHNRAEAASLQKQVGHTQRLFDP